MAVAACRQLGSSGGGGSSRQGVGSATLADMATAAAATTVL